VYEIAFDRLWPRLHGGDNRVHGVKIDVQGAEAYVVSGMRDTLERYKPRLVIEYHSYADLPRFLETLEIVGYSRVGHDVDRPSTQPTSELQHGHNYEFRPK
jgi:hypothetical protein